MSKIFKPFKLPNDSVDVNTLQFPLLASRKLDGLRLVVNKGGMFTCSLKQFPNVQLQGRFEHLMKISRGLNLLLDGELLAKSLTFYELSGLCRRLDAPLPEDLYFYAFDAVQNEQYDMEFSKRISYLDNIAKYSYVKVLEQRLVKSIEEVWAFYEEALKEGHCDGLILRSPMGRYKCGRATINEGLGYKLKPFETIDSAIIGVVQATEVDPRAEKTINELGRSTTSKKLGDRILIEKASAFVVKYEGKDLKVTIAMTDIEKEEIWKNKDSYIGRWIEFKAMRVGMLEDGLPRHPTTLRMRTDKD